MPQLRAVSSRQNPVVKQFRQAFKLGLSDDGLVAVEGPRIINEAIRSGIRIERVLFSHIGHQQHGARLVPQLSKHCETLVVDDDVFRSATQVEHPQGVAALVRVPQHTLADVLTRRATREQQTPMLLVAAAGLQDPGNLGTLLRAADAFGADALATVDDTVSPWNAKSVRASAGAIFHIPVLPDVDPSELIRACETNGIALLSTAARSGSELPTTDLRGPVCIVIGQEGGGVPRELQRAASGSVAIPMVREVESLNAGVAGAIILYEAARQRRRT